MLSPLTVICSGALELKAEIIIEIGVKFLPLIADAKQEADREKTTLDHH
jgi:hypothetical protein